MKTMKDIITRTEQEWVWINGYKGTDKDMCCRGYQFELVNCGYSPVLAELIIEDGDEEKAIKLAGCPELSMDAEVFIIFKD